MSSDPNRLSRRERQAMDVLYRLGKATAAEVREGMPNPPTITAVRTHLTILQSKNLVKYERDGARYVYEPVVPHDEMAKNVIAGVVSNFFGGSVERLVATLVDKEEANLSDEDLRRLGEIIEQARRKA